MFRTNTNLVAFRTPDPPDVGQLGVLWVDSDAAVPNLYQCTNLSPLTYTSIAGGGGGGAAWGGITGTLSAQTDLQAALDAKDALGAAAAAQAASQPLDATLTALAGLDTTTGLLEQTGTDTFTKRAVGIGASTSIPTRADADARYDAAGAAAAAQAASQPLDGDLTSIAGLGGTSGLLRKTGANTWTLDTSAFLTANQTITLSSDVTGSGTTAIAVTIANGAVTLAKMANLAANSIIGNNTGAGATPLALTGTQVTAMLDVFTSALKGLVPASGGGTSNFLRADGAWAVPAGGGGGSFTATQTTVTAPYPAALTQRVNVVDASVSATSKILVSVAGVAETATNTADFNDLESVVGVPQAGSIDFVLSFARPNAGPFVLNYAVSA